MPDTSKGLLLMKNLSGTVWCPRWRGGLVSRFYSIIYQSNVSLIEYLPETSWTRRSITFEVTGEDSDVDLFKELLILEFTTE